MKNYSISVDFVMNKYIDIEAESEEDAVRKLELRISANPYDYAHNFGCYVGSEIISVEESE